MPDKSASTGLTITMFSLSKKKVYSKNRATLAITPCITSHLMKPVGNQMQIIGNNYAITFFYLLSYVFWLKNHQKK